MKTTEEELSASRNRPHWDQLYMTMCYLIAMRSRDPSTHVGSVIVDADNVLVSTGYNSLPRGIDPDMYNKRLSREGGEKYFWIEHGERNAIYNAARRGTTLKGCKLYVPWTPCFDCARAIIQTGIAEVVVHKNGQDFYDRNTDGKWKVSEEKVREMFIESGVVLQYIEMDIVIPEIFMNGRSLDAAVHLNK